MNQRFEAEAFTDLMWRKEKRRTYSLLEVLNFYSLKALIIIVDTIDTYRDGSSYVGAHG